VQIFSRPSQLWVVPWVASHHYYIVLNMRWTWGHCNLSETKPNPWLFWWRYYLVHILTEQWFSAIQRVCCLLCFCWLNCSSVQLSVALLGTMWIHPTGLDLRCGPTGHTVTCPTGLDLGKHATLQSQLPGFKLTTFWSLKSPTNPSDLTTAPMCLDIVP